MFGLIKECEDLANYLFSLRASDAFGEYTDLRQNENFGNIMVDDLGDSVPFIAWLGLHCNDYLKIADDYTKTLIKKYQLENGLFVTNKPSNLKAGLKSLIIDANKMSDTAVGLELMFAITKDDFYLKSADLFFKGLKRTISKRGFVSYLNIAGLNIPFSSGSFCGLYIEELCYMYQWTGLQHFLKLAEQLAAPWLNLDFFQKYNLFPFVSDSSLAQLVSLALGHHTGLSLNSAMSVKANTNLIFGLSKLYSLNKDAGIKNALELWLKGVDSRLKTEQNMFHAVWDPKKSGRYIFLGYDHAVIDALLEINRATKNERALTLARSAADAWLELQHDCGLMPQGIGSEQLSFVKEHQIKHNSSRLDSQTDFAIVLFKLAEITSQNKYAKAARKIISGIIKCHKYKKAFAEFVDLENLNQSGFVIETKYLFLLLKLFLLADWVGKGNKIYSDPLVRALVRDR